MENKSSTGAGGRKVFLLYPHSVVQEKMLDTLIMNGFETYTLRDYKKAFRIMEKFPDSIMLINIDEGLPENEWETYIRGIQKNTKTKDTRLGIVSYNKNQGLMEKYLLELEVPCGYIQLKLSLKESTEIIQNALNANEARGRRQHIRAFCNEGVSATMNYRNNKGLFQGRILDISIAGIAARISGLPDLPSNFRLRDVQLKLHGQLIMTDLILAGQRKDDKNILILLFDPEKLDDDAKTIIHRFIKVILQNFIDNIMK